MKRIFEIRGCVKNYEWGKVGKSSTVVQLQSSAFSDFVPDDLPYAELWMGTHESGPAYIPSLNSMKLIDWIQSHPECLGNKIKKFYDPCKGLPFLFKVLSVNKALSIQVHPNKERAVKLHRDFPQHYPDDNHKPEMAIALTEFEALCGFRPLTEIRDFLVSMPQMKILVGQDIFERFITSPSESDLKTLFTMLLTCSPDIFQVQLSEISDYFKQNSLEDSLCQSVRDLFLRTVTQYPGDIGCFCLFFLNYLKLKPGDAIFLAANEPHAYLLGDCIECMACSDNVVRAGLTPKFKDVQTLCDILTYKCKTAEENIFPYTKDPNDPYLKIYTPPVKEFAVDVVSLPLSCKLYTLRSIDSASILLLTQGTATYKYEKDDNELYQGQVLFISSGCNIQIEPKTDMLMFRAYSNG